VVGCLGPGGAIRRGAGGSGIVCPVGAAFVARVRAVAVC